MFDKTCTRKDFFKVMGAGVGSLFIAAPSIVTSVVAVVAPGLLPTAEPVEQTMLEALATKADGVEAALDFKDPIAQILVQMPDFELFATLKGCANTDLSYLGTRYPWLCNRVAELAGHWNEMYPGGVFHKMLTVAGDD